MSREIKVLNDEEAADLALWILGVHQWQMRQERRLLNRIRRRLGRPMRYSSTQPREPEVGRPMTADDLESWS